MLPKSQLTYPLHKAAFHGKVRELSQALRQGPEQPDLALKDPHGMIEDFYAFLMPV